MTIRKGRPWGEPAAGPPDVEVNGGDVDLAAMARDHPGASVWFRPDATSDLARAVGLVDQDEPGGLDVPVDALRVFDGFQVGGATAVNAVVFGTAPDRLRWWTRASEIVVVVDGRERFRGHATTVVVANGQFLHGNDVAPRGHPGDGRFEVQVYALGRRERAGLRTRLPLGTHVPHPSIREMSGRTVTVRWSAGAWLDVDGEQRGPVSTVTIEIAPAALRLRV
jgi:hypothetical protein